ncbi:piwi domain protein [Ancylostoma ceylanicum]|uniref:Piwi domain protein n=1 Tax=Ancylostoma ceylanicum TaxID=53326 RepID=A0A0D6LLT6_9BILA|nr:piwi domain protein [Ancylostoma ceylanicum]
MTVEPASEIFILKRNTPENIKDWVAAQKTKGRKFLMFLSSNGIKMHGYIKLLEVVFQVATQEIIGNKVDDVVVKRQNQTLDNVLAKVADTYMKAIRTGIASIALKTKPTLTAVVCSSDHNERIYKSPIVGRNASEQNIPPGTVVDTKIVSPVINEFYLNSHSAIQGTANTPKYSLVFDDSDIPMDALELITHGLCFLHAIMPATVAEPVPLKVAGNSAKRGHDNFIANS